MSATGDRAGEARNLAAGGGGRQTRQERGRADLPGPPDGDSILPMTPTARPVEPDPGIVRIGPFAGFVPRFDELIASSSSMVLYFIHSRRWRENHDAAIKAFLGREGTAWRSSCRTWKTTS